MTLRQLKDSILGEAGIPNPRQYEGWLHATIIELLDSYTAVVKYDDLYINSEELAISASGLVVAPDYLQHWDFKNIVYRPLGSEDDEYRITVQKKKPDAFNEGITTFFYPTYDATNSELGLQSLQLWPTDNIDVTDTLLVNYWRKATEFPQQDASVIIPTQLFQVLKKELISRAVLMAGDAKKFASYRMLLKEDHSRSMGVTNVSDMNGE
jgi:hypothetical protein